MKNLIITLLVIFIGGFIGTSNTVAGQSTVSEKFVYDASFDDVLQAFRSNENQLWRETLGRVEVVGREGDIVKMRLELPRRTANFSLKVNEDVDFTAKRATFSSKLVETNGFLQDQQTQVVVVEEDGRVLVSVEVYAHVPTVRTNFIRFDLRRSVLKMAEKVRVILEKDKLEE